MRIFISSTVVYHLFGDASCCFADIVIITTFFRTLSMLNQIIFIRKLCFILILKQKLNCLPWKGTSVLALSGSRVFNLFFIDLMIKLPYLPWYGNTKTWCFRSVTGGNLWLLELWSKVILRKKTLFVYVVVTATCFLTNFYPLYQDLVNKEVFYSFDGLWKFKPKY